jgi:hypothetical protein
MPNSEAKFIESGFSLVDWTLGHGFPNSARVCATSATPKATIF